MVGDTTKVEKMLRVSDVKINCPVCGKPDWCLISPDGYVAICPRTKSGRSLGEAGYLHFLAGNEVNLDDNFKTKKSKSKASINWVILNKLYTTNLKVVEKDIGSLFEGISYSTMKRLDIGFDLDGAITFPVRDYDGTIVGIQKRNYYGSKYMVRGSKSGLFIPCGLNLHDEYLLICEGASDTLTALELGFSTVGRMSCTNGIKILKKFFKEWNGKPKNVIVADSDEVGIAGAKKLSKALDNIAHILIPPRKDFREWITEDKISYEYIKELLEEF